MSDTHPGDVLIATALLLGVEFTGNEEFGFHARADGRYNGPYYCKRTCAADALMRMGYKIHADGDVTLRSK